MTNLSLAVTRRTILEWSHCAKCKDWCMGGLRCVVVFQEQGLAFIPIKETECFDRPRDFRKFYVPNFGGTVWGLPKPVTTGLWPVLDELEKPAQSHDLNPAEHLWDELEQRLQVRSSCATSVCDLTNALLEEWFYKHRVGAVILLI